MLFTLKCGQTVEVTKRQEQFTIESLTLRHFCQHTYLMAKEEMGQYQPIILLEEHMARSPEFDCASYDHFELSWTILNAKQTSG